MADIQQQYQHLLTLRAVNPQQFEQGLLNIILANVDLLENNIKTKEQSILLLGEFYSQQKQAKSIQNLIYDQQIRNLLNDFPRAKTAKIIKNLIDYVSKIENTVDIQIDLCEHLIKWCIEEKRTYLRHRVQIKLAQLFWQKNQFLKSLEIIDQLLQEVRKTDDKHLLVEIQLQESKVQHSLENFAKSKASLTAARAGANMIYCPPALQADIDSMSGILAAEDKDYKTAYSYFYESFEAFNMLEDSRAEQILTYMLLSKIMSSNTDDVYLVLNGKYGLKYAGRKLEAMKTLADAHKQRSLTNFKQALHDYNNEIANDPIIKNHISQLYENLLEINLLKVVQPYSRVEIDYLAQLINLDVDIVQNKLSEMILDKKIDGTLDQGTGCLILFDDLKCDDLYSNAIGTIQNMNLVVDKLFEKAKLIKQ